MPDVRCVICGSDLTTLRCPSHPGYVEGTHLDIFCCNQCDTHFVLPQALPPGIYETIYSKPDLPGYDRYRRYMRKIREMTSPLRFLASEEAAYYVVMDYLRQKSGLKILDVGCGCGFLTYALRREGFDAIGVDISRTAVASAKHEFGDYFYLSDIETFAAECDATFDLILALEVIEHLADPGACIRRLLALLRPDGRILVTTPNRGYHPRRSVWQTDLPPVHTVWLSEKSVLALCRRNRLNCRFVSLRGHYPAHQNKLWWYLSTRWKPLRSPVLKTSGDRAEGPRMRKLLQGLAHEIYPVRTLCNFVHNRCVRMDETMGLVIWGGDV